MKSNLNTDIADMLAQDKERKFVNWADIKNWWPVLGMVISIVLTYSSLDRRLALVEQKLDALISLQTQQLQKYSDVETRYGALAIRVNTLETLMGIRK